MSVPLEEKTGELIMLFHASIDANDPERVAKVIAEFLGGEAFDFVPLNNGSWVTIVDDDRCTAVEVYPRGLVLSYEAERGMEKADSTGGSGRSATHLAMETVLTEEQVHAIGKREGWPTRVTYRRSGFHVIELWVEGCAMIEWLTPEYKKEYLEANTLPKWRAAMEGAAKARGAAAAGS